MYRRLGFHHYPRGGGCKHPISLDLGLFFSMDAPVRRGETIVCSNGIRGRGRPTKSWMEVIKHDLKNLGLVEDMTHDRKL